MQAAHILDVFNSSNTLLRRGVKQVLTDSLVINDNIALTS